jgi:serine/threonine protein kinase/tetratricopeptide (TPR) repeat protein
MSSLHERAGEVFLAALALPAAERDGFLLEACRGDEALLREVGSLLLFHESDDPAGADPFAGRTTYSAGDVFAGRYRMIERVGRGGMGDVWKVDDLTLQIPVALKLMASTSLSERVRLLHEARLARQITHPAVCRVFDVGEAGETIFFSMEFVQGEDLAALLKRSGRLTSERVVEIGRQLCAGLAAAHAEGVLHRDLKPANVLIDSNGRVRITDFGIAVTTSDAGPRVLIGTLGYMAPEQLAADGHVSERTDVYGLGVILYELVTGQPHHVVEAADKASQLPILAPGINARLQRAIAKAIAADPRDRPATASALAAELPTIDTTTDSGVTRRFSKRAGAAVAVALAAAASVLIWMRPSSPVLTDRDTIVVADFLNSTGDPVFDSTLKVALSVALEQSPFLKVFPDERAHQTLVLMQRSPEKGITRDIARAIAQREQLKALVSGSITTLGRHYVVALEAVNAESGDVVAREQVEVNSKEEVLSAMGGAVSRLRRKLGESLGSIQRYDVPLPQATTPSLDALQAYARALDDGRINPRLEAIPHLKRAIELDPHFALAMALLSGVYTNTGQTELAPEWSRKAFDLRDRVSERERYFISWRYYRDATLAFDRGLELARSWTAAYPRESFAFNSLGWAAWSLGQYRQAIAPLRESIRLDARFIPPVSNLIATLIASNQFDAARRVLDESRALGLEHIAIRREAYLLALVNDDAAGMTRELDAALAKPEGPMASNWLPRASVFAGRFADAHEQFRRSIAATTDANRAEVSGVYSAQEAESHAVVGQCTDARREAARATRVSHDNATVASAARAFAWCGDGAEAMNLSADLDQRFPEAILTTHLVKPVIAAAIAVKNARSADAPALLEPVRRFDHSPVAQFWPAYLRGEALRQLGHQSEAADEFRSIIDHRGEAPDSPLYPLAHLGLARALASAGDRAGARQAYRAFFAVWKDADSELLPLKEAHREFARLEH